MAPPDERDLSTAPRLLRLAVFAGVFLISAASLALEVLLTRIFSVMMWHHYAFLAVSIAMLGFGASAALLAAAQAAQPSPGPAGPVEPPAWARHFPNYWRLLNALRAAFEVVRALAARGLSWLNRAGTSSLLWGSALAFALSVPLSLLAITHLPFTAGLGGLAAWPTRVLSIGFYVAAAVPFAFVGVALTTALTRARSLIGAVYAADLLGAGAGGAIGVMLLRPLGGPGAVGAVGVLGAVAAAAFASLAPRRSARGWTLGAIPILVLATVALGHLTVPLLTGKAHGMYPGGGASSRMLLSEWNPLSRVDLISPSGTPIEPGRRDLPGELWVFIDGKALTEIAHAGPGVDLRWLTERGPSLPYLVGRPGRVLVIGAGGGIDVRTALTRGARHVTAVEINPLIADLVKGPYAWYAGDLYSLPQVRLVVGEGRHFVQYTRERYDLVQLSLVDTWAAAASGAYSLSESRLYTVEAFEAYLGRLRPGGMVAITRWVGPSDAEILRVCSVAMTALQRRGVQDAARCMVVVQDGNQGSVLVRGDGFSADEVARVSRVCRVHRWMLRYAAKQAESDDVFTPLFASGGSDAYYRRQLLDVRPSTDDWPFFFDLSNQRVTRRHWAPLSLLIGGNDSKGRSVLRATFRMAALLSAVFIVGPLLMYRRRGIRAPGWMAWLGYFGVLGLGFMAIEMLLMQRLVLFLGHPTYSVTVVLSALLVSCGLGSLATGRIRRPGAALVGAVIVLLAWMWVHYALWGRVGDAAMRWPLAGRLAVAVALIAPGGFVLGMPLPLGLRAASERSAALTPWAWGVNLCFSVVGSIASVFVAMVYGLHSELALGAVCYALVPLLFLTAMRRAGRAAS